MADARSFERAASFLPVPLPGRRGRDPPPLADGAELPGQGLRRDPAGSRHRAGAHERVGEADAATVLRVRENRALSPLTSGAGRLFEAAAALAGLCDRNTFEGEAAMRLEAAAGGRSGCPTRSRRLTTD